MVKEYIAGNYYDKFTANSKAKIDAEEIIKKLGYINVGLKRSFLPRFSFKTKLRYLLNRLKIEISLKKDASLFIQFPSTKNLKMMQLAKKKGCKIIMLIHDLNSLRGKVVKTERKCLELADILIVHTKEMKEYLIETGINKDFVILEIFDYLNGSLSPVPTDYNNINIGFAGNLGKSLFIDKCFFENVSLNLFGIGVESRSLNKGVSYVGCFSPEELAKNMNVHYGLVWDGDNVDTCDSELGNYLRLIASHKISMYLSAGIPVIVWEDSAMASFVKDHQVGLTVKNLHELDSRLKDISTEKYNEMRKNARKLAKSLADGYFLKTAVTQAEHLLLSQK